MLKLIEAKFIFIYPFNQQNIPTFILLVAFMSNFTSVFMLIVESLA